MRKWLSDKSRAVVGLPTLFITLAQGIVALITTRRTSLQTIPQGIDYETPSAAAICLHEAGHATAALMTGIAPVLMEFVDDPGSPGLARTRMPLLTQSQRETVACAAFAVEYQLFRRNRLVDSKGVPLLERDFIQIALGSNAAQDKVNYFGANHERSNGTWPKPYDEAFMRRGIDLAANLKMPLVIELAEVLLNERRLLCPRIIEIGAKHLPHIAPAWKCESNNQGAAGASPSTPTTSS
ncbi:hypothetical protein AB7008_23660 [Bradyrhizobium sp. 521_C7_N1_3]|uniref:hypothetical protein n=1 Tax=Bradyrhizobium sp. 521_C7_N1_3 TaxID=3240368 RepID=UPI003F89CF5D